MTDVYLVTGLMRSGTSFLAEALHKAGVPMGSFMRFPTMNPLAGFEWEDALLAEPLMAVVTGDRYEPRQIIGQYIETRGHGTWGVKTPFLMPFVGMFSEILVSIGMKPHVFITDRDYQETLASIRQQVSHLEGNGKREALERAETIQEVLSSYWREASEGASVFNAKESMENPDSVVARVHDIVHGAEG